MVEEGNGYGGKIIAPYKNGRRHGVLKEYHYDGELCLVATYKNGRLVNEKSYYSKDNGVQKIWAVILYKNGYRVSGKGYFKDGRLKWEIKFKDNIRAAPLKCNSKNKKIFQDDDEEPTLWYPSHIGIIERIDGLCGWY